MLSYHALHLSALTTFPLVQLAAALLLLGAIAAVVLRPAYLAPDERGARRPWLERHTDAIDAIPDHALGAR